MKFLLRVPRGTRNFFDAIVSRGTKSRIVEFMFVPRGTSLVQIFFVKIVSRGTFALLLLRLLTKLNLFHVKQRWNTSKFL